MTAWFETKNEVGREVARLVVQDPMLHNYWPSLCLGPFAMLWRGKDYHLVDDQTMLVKHSEVCNSRTK